MSVDSESALLIGWASREITPERPALLRGQFHARVSEGVMDPVTVTALRPAAPELEDVFVAVLEENAR